MDFCSIQYWFHLIFIIRLLEGQMKLSTVAFQKILIFGYVIIFFENRLFQFLALFDEKRKQKCSFLAIIFEKMNKKMKKTVEPNKIL